MIEPKGLFADESIDVHLCCNDPDNGCFTGRIEMMQVGPNLELEAWPHRPRLRYLDRKVSIAGAHYRITHYKQWYGNWCWDLVKMPGSEVVRMLNRLSRRGWFSVHEAEERLYAWWENGHTWTDGDIRLIGKDFESLP